MQGRWWGYCKIDPAWDIPLAATLSDGNGASILMDSCLFLPKGTTGLLSSSGTAVCLVLQVQFKFEILLMLTKHFSVARGKAPTLIGVKKNGNTLVKWSWAEELNLYPSPLSPMFSFPGKTFIHQQEQEASV